VGSGVVEEYIGCGKGRGTPGGRCMERGGKSVGGREKVQGIIWLRKKRVGEGVGGGRGTREVGGGWWRWWEGGCGTGVKVWV